MVTSASSRSNSSIPDTSSSGEIEPLPPHLKWVVAFLNTVKIKIQTVLTDRSVIEVVASLVAVVVTTINLGYLKR